MNHLPCGTCCHCNPPSPDPPGVNDSADLGSSFCQWWFKITIARISGFRPLKYMWDEVMWSVRSAIQTSLYSLPLHTHMSACMCVCVTVHFYVWNERFARAYLCDVVVGMYLSSVGYKNKFTSAMAVCRKHTEIWKKRKKKGKMYIILQTVSSLRA